MRELRVTGVGTILGTLVCIAAGAALMLARQPGVPALRSIWAEDGMFLDQAFEPDQVSAWFRPYAGYLHAVPRLVATVVAMLPLEWASFALSGGAAVLAAAIGVFVFRAANGVIESMALRLWLGTIPLVLPTVGWESMNNISNIQVFLLYGSVWALLARPAGAVDRWSGVAVAAAATLTTPLALLLAPLVLLRWLRTRQPSAHLVTAAWVIGLVVQAAVALTAGGPVGTDPTQFEWLPRLYALRVVLASALGIKLADGAWAIFGAAAPILVAFAGLGLLLYVRSRPAIRGTVFVLGLISVALFLVGFALRWSPSLVPAPQFLGLSSARLTVVPTLLLLVAAALVLDSPDPRVRPTTWRSLVLALLAWTVFVFGVDYFPTANPREPGPDWIVTIDGARTLCAQAGTPSVIAPIAPPGWYVEVPCHRLIE